MKIKDWSDAEKPRERLMTLGPEAVSNAELLAILIGSGTPEMTSVDIMRIIMHEHGDSLRTVASLTRQELEKYNGIGPAKAVTIQAAMELGKRLMRETKGAKTRFLNSTDSYDFFRSHIMDMHYEECHLLLLDVKNQAMGHHLISRGGISESVVDIRLVLRHALVSGAPNIILAHNHPSGNPYPSRQDDELTTRLNKACKTVSLRLLDHIIIGDDSYFSYADEGKI